MQCERCIVQLRAVQPGPERCDDQQRKRHDHRRATGIVNPFAQAQPAHRRICQQCYDRSEQHINKSMVFRQAGRRGPDHIGHFTGYLKQDGGDRAQRIGPDIPCRHETHRVAERPPCPFVQPAFQRHFPVQEIHRHGHRCVEQHEGQQPDGKLCAPNAGGDAYPGTAHHGQHLRQHKVAQAKLSLQLVASVG